MATEKQIAEMVSKVCNKFRCFGNGKYTVGNPISYALAEEPAQFAAGVDVKDVVKFILKESKKYS